jgi:hypothetical protein
MSDTDAIAQDIEECSGCTVSGNGFRVAPQTPGDHRMLAFARSTITPQAPYIDRQPVWQHLGSVGAHRPSDQNKNTDSGFKRKRVESSADDDSDDNGQSDISSFEHSDLMVLEGTPDIDMDAVD